MMRANAPTKPTRAEGSRTTDGHRQDGLAGDGEAREGLATRPADRGDRATSADPASDFHTPQTLS